MKALLLGAETIMSACAGYRGVDRLVQNLPTSYDRRIAKKRFKRERLAPAKLSRLLA